MFNDSNVGELIIPKNKVRAYDYIKNHPGSHLRKMSKELHCLTKLRIVVTVIVHYVFSLGL
ncbi:MAG: hypothetical protein WBZ36_28925 [Candidatus Nitrosopolaris sp.]